MADTRPVGLVFFGMEISPQEAVSMLDDAATIAALISGYSPQNANWSVVQKMARDFQLSLSKKHGEPGRLLVRCATCGQSRKYDDAILGDVPDGYALVPNPPLASPVVSPPEPNQPT